MAAKNSSKTVAAPRGSDPAGCAASAIGENPLLEYDHGSLLVHDSLQNVRAVSLFLETVHGMDRPVSSVDIDYALSLIQSVVNKALGSIIDAAELLEIAARREASHD